MADNKKENLAIVKNYINKLIIPSSKKVSEKIIETINGLDHVKGLIYGL